jgi:hypothetical protein
MMPGNEKKPAAKEAAAEKSLNAASFRGRTLASATPTTRPLPTAATIFAATA